MKVKAMLGQGASWKRVRDRLGRSTFRPATRPLAQAVEVSRDAPVSRSELDAGDLEHLLEDVLASCPDPLFVVDAQGFVVAINQAGRELRFRLGMDAERPYAIETILRATPLLDGDGAPPMFEAPRIGSLTSLVLAEEFGSEPVYDLRVTRRTSPDGGRCGHIVQLVDVTPLLSAMRGRAAANRHRDGILSLLSHDLRSPQAAILATLNHADFAAVPTNLRQIIERAARRSLHMVDSLVRSVRAESADYTFEPIDLAHILEEVADSAWSQASDNNVRIDLRLGSDGFVVLADRGMLNRALTDVLNDLVKFSVAGQPITVRLESGTLGGEPAVTCEFTGTVRHISDGELARIFSRFSASQKSDVGSLGDSDGLRLMRTVIRRHRGVVTSSELSSSQRNVAIILPLFEGADYREVVEGAVLTGMTS